MKHERIYIDWQGRIGSFLDFRRGLNVSSADVMAMIRSGALVPLFAADALDERLERLVAKGKELRAFEEELRARSHQIATASAPRRGAIYDVDTGERWASAALAERSLGVANVPSAIRRGLRVAGRRLAYVVKGGGR